MKVLPCNVTLADSRESDSVPDEMLVASRLVRLAPEPEKRLAIMVPEMLALPVWAEPGVVAWSWM